MPQQSVINSVKTKRDKKNSICSHFYPKVCSFSISGSNWNVDTHTETHIWLPNEHRSIPTHEVLTPRQRTYSLTQLKNYSSIENHFGMSSLITARRRVAYMDFLGIQIA